MHRTVHLGRLPLLRKAATATAHGKVDFPRMFVGAVVLVMCSFSKECVVARHSPDDCEPMERKAWEEEGRTSTLPVVWTEESQSPLP